MTISKRTGKPLPSPLPAASAPYVPRYTEAERTIILAGGPDAERDARLRKRLWYVGVGVLVFAAGAFFAPLWLLALGIPALARRRAAQPAALVTGADVDPFTVLARGAGTVHGNTVGYS